MKEFLYVAKDWVQSTLHSYYFGRCPNCQKYYSAGHGGPGFRGAFSGQGTCARPECVDQVKKINAANRPFIQRQLDEHYSKIPVVGNGF